MMAEEQTSGGGMGLALFYHSIFSVNQYEKYCWYDNRNHSHNQFSFDIFIRPVWSDELFPMDALFGRLIV